MNADDVESLAWDLIDARRHDLLRPIGVKIWGNWSDGIKKGRHPQTKDLVAFLREFAARAGDQYGDWLPLGMAKYLADRLDPEFSKQHHRHRPRRSNTEEGERFSEGVRIAINVLLQWRHERSAGTPYAQQAALNSVADAMELPEVEVRLAFSKHRKTAEAIVKYMEAGHSVADLSAEEREAIVAGPEEPETLIMSCLTEGERDLIAAGASLDDVLFGVRQPPR